MSVSRHVSTRYSDLTLGELQNIKGYNETENPVKSVDGNLSDVRYTWRGRFLYARTTKTAMDEMTRNADDRYEELEIGTIADNLSEVQLPVFKKTHIMFWIIIFTDIAISRIILHHFISGLVFTAIYLTLFASIAIIKRMTEQSSLQNFYDGSVCNAVLNIQCKAGPALYSKYTAGLLLGLGSTSFKIAALIVAATIPPDESVFSCAEKSDCLRGNFQCRVLTVLFEFFFFSYLIILVGIRKKLTETADYAINFETEKLEQFSDTCRTLIRQAETRVSSLKSFTVVRRGKLQIGVAAATTLAALRFVQSVTRQNDTPYDSNDIQWYHHVSLAVSALFTAIVTFCVLLAFVFQTFAIWATYQGLYLRLRVLSNFLADSLAKSPTCVKSWWMVRHHDMTILFPLVFSMTNAYLSLCLLFVIFLVVRVFLQTYILVHIDFEYAGGTVKTLRVLGELWFQYCVLIFVVVSFVIALRRAESIGLEQTRHAQLIQEIMLTKVLDKAVCGSIIATEGKHDNFDDIHEDVAISSGDICIDMLRKVRGFIVKRDEPAKILGISVTPLLVRSFLTYIVSAMGIIVITIIQDETAFAR